MLSLLPRFPRPMIKAIVGQWRRRWLIVAVAWLIGIAGWYALTLIPDHYESRAQIYINSERVIDASASDVGTRIDRSRWVRIIRAQLLSRDNLERLIYETGMDQFIATPIERERMIDGLASAIAVDSNEEQLFTIRYRNTDPVLAQRVVVTILDIFIEQNLSSATEDVTIALRTLDSEIDERTAELNEIETRIATFRRLNADELLGTERLSRRLEVKEEEIGRVLDQVAAVGLRRERILSTLADTPRYTSGSSVDQLLLQLAQLRSQYNDNHPDIARLQSQIDQFQSDSTDLPTNPEYLQLQRELRTAEDEIRSLRSREERLQGEVDDLVGSVSLTPQAEQTLVGLLREKDRVQALLDRIVGEREETNFQAGINRSVGAVSYRQFEAPRIAEEPTWPNRGLLTLAVLMLGLGGGVGLAFVLTQIDKGYTTGTDLEEAFGLPLLGTVTPAPRPTQRVSQVGRSAVLACLYFLLVATAVTLFWWYEIRAGEDAEVLPTTALLEEGDAR